MNYIINIEHLTYHYQPHVKALDDVTIQVPKGAIYGFLGPNGAGKSTTMRLLSGLMYDEGENIKLFGHPINAQLPQVFERVGSLIEQPVLYQHLTAKDHLELIINANELKEVAIDEILQQVDLLAAKDTQVKRYSLGMKQRLAIALCLVKSPELLLLDEPVNGLDPTGMQEVRQLLMKLNKELGLTIFISSHLLSEIEKMCSHVCIIHKGKIHYAGLMVDLKKQFDATPVQVTIGAGHVYLPEYNYTQEDHVLHVTINNKEDIPKVIKSLVAQDIAVFNVVQQGNLESWFLDIVQ